MTLKEELEILRSEPIEVFSGDPMDIPCIETSDVDKLCKHPVASVLMITYNHEPYIRQAIEGVMMQKTDFEFELVIGEDCSQDKTREICFEYKKKHPDKIRVLWWYENVSKMGGNGRRCRARCRGEFIALCEGDDYWTDPLKLQKQVDLIRRQNAAMCVAFTTWKWPDGHERINWYPKKEFITQKDLQKHYFHTSTYLIRRDVLEKISKTYNQLTHIYDVTIEHGAEEFGRICLLPEVVSVYRKTSHGMTAGLHGEAYGRFVARQHFELYLYGPKKARPYFLDVVRKMVDVEFLSSRSYRTTDCLKSKWREYIDAHLMLIHLEEHTPIKREVCFWLNVAWFFCRRVLEGIGLGFVLKRFPAERDVN